jgi:ribosomal protein L14E/L6E/L27E
MLRLKRFKIRATILVFGSARAKSQEDYEAALAAAQTILSKAAEGEPKQLAQKAVDRIEKTAWMGAMTEKVRQQQQQQRITSTAVQRGCQNQR